MEHLPKNLRLELNRKQLPDNVVFEFVQHGRTAYAELYTAVRENQLDERQTSNALYILFALTKNGFGSHEEILRLCLELTSDERVQVRSEAVSLIITFTRLSLNTLMKIPSGKLDIVKPYIEKALQKGLNSPNLHTFAEKFLKGEL